MDKRTSEKTIKMVYFETIDGTMIPFPITGGGFDYDPTSRVTLDFPEMFLGPGKRIKLVACD